MDNITATTQATCSTLQTHLREPRDTAGLLQQRTGTTRKGYRLSKENSVRFIPFLWKQTNKDSPNESFAIREIQIQQDIFSPLLLRKTSYSYHFSIEERMQTQPETTQES